MIRFTQICELINSIIKGGIGIYFFIIPGGLILHHLNDPGFRDPEIPQLAWQLHRDLTPAHDQWARQRMASNKATELTIDDISGTEWPLFGCVFYLWATESLQQAWEMEPNRQGVAPKDYAEQAIHSAADLVFDPGHAKWVKDHWGDDYLHRENVFYRMLLIAAGTAHFQLTADDRHLDVLRDQVETLSSELAESPHGLLDDYPGECYPTDVLTAVACIRRADQVLGTDHSEFARSALRAFQGQYLDSRRLPPYAAESWSGKPNGTSRGCSNAYGCLFAPELWPEVAADWYQQYEKYFWQYSWTGYGFREFPNDLPGGEWYADVDAGPVLAGHGIAASAFGLGAARRNGRFDHAFPLAAEMLAVSWPLPNRILVMPRILSNAADAPYLGESAILFNMTRLPDSGMTVRSGGNVPLFVYILILLYFGMGLFLSFISYRGCRQLRRHPDSIIPMPSFQFFVWGVLLINGLLMGLYLNVLMGAILILCGLLFPRSTLPEGSSSFPADSG